MEINNLIVTGNKLELQKIRHVKYFDEEIYVSSFLYSRKDREAVVEMPMNKGRVVMLEIGEAFMVTFYTNKGLYKCQVVVIDRFYEEDRPVASVLFQSNFEKLQRRQYYRMECLMNLTYRVVTKAETERIIRKKLNSSLIDYNQGEVTEPVRNIEGVALDISGGGIRFNSPCCEEEGKVILLQLPFPKEEAMNLQFLFAKLLTCTPVPNRAGLYDHRAEFVLISNDERESIIRFIFKEERNRRKKILGNL